MSSDSLRTRQEEIETTGLGRKSCWAEEEEEEEEDEEGDEDDMCHY